MNTPELRSQRAAQTLAAMLRTLHNAKSIGCSIHDLAEAVYGLNPPALALPSTRVKIARYNARGEGPRIIRHTDGRLQSSLYYIEGYEPQRIKSHEPDQAEPPPPPPPAFTIDRIASRFAPGCQPRWGR